MIPRTMIPHTDPLWHLTTSYRNKPNISKILAEPVYQSSYRFARNLLNNKAEAAKINKIQALNLGKDDPAKALLLMKAAEKYAFEDYWRSSKSEPSLLKFLFNVAKTKLKLRFSKDVNKAQDEFDQKYKELYPNTHKMRTRLINDEQVVADNDSYLERTRTV